MTNLIQYYHAVTGKYPSPSNPMQFPVGPNGAIPGALIPVPPGYRFIADMSQYRKFHVIRSGFDVSKGDEAQTNFKFDALFVPTNLTGDEFITLISGGPGWEVVELYEKGMGRFMAGMRFTYGSKNSKEKTLTQLGFKQDPNIIPIKWVVLKKA
jgi:hypothetical protein